MAAEKMFCHMAGLLKKKRPLGVSGPGGTAMAIDYNPTVVTQWHCQACGHSGDVAHRLDTPDATVSARIETSHLMRDQRCGTQNRLHHVEAVILQPR
jgi:hypothetical protein